MKIFIGSDHRGFELKNKLVEWLKSQEHDVTDCGNTVYDPLDDFVDFANKVAISVQSSTLNPLPSTPQSLGILICGSGIGVCVAANRHKGVRCGLGFDPHQIQHARQNDLINSVALPSDYIDFEKAKVIITAFLEATPKTEEKYLRRAKKLDE